MGNTKRPKSSQSFVASVNAGRRTRYVTKMAVAIDAQASASHSIHVAPWCCIVVGVWP